MDPTILPVDLAGWGILGLALLALGYVSRKLIDYLVADIAAERKRCEGLIVDNKEFATVNVALTAALKTLSDGVDKHTDGLGAVEGRQREILNQLERLHGRLDRFGIARERNDAQPL